MRRIAGIVLAVLLTAGVVVAVVAGRSEGDKGTATKTVRMVIGSEKAEFFADPDVVKALAAKGYTVRAETSGSWAMEGLDLEGYDLAFPSSQAPATELAAKYKVRQGGRDGGKVVASGAEVERTAPLLHKLVSVQGAQQSSTDAAFRDFVSGAVRSTSAPLLHKLVSVQGAQQSSTDAAFRDFVSGAGNPLVLVYESQVASLLAGGQQPDDLVVLYPDTTVNSDHTAVPLTENGTALATLLSTDPRLRGLEIRHGFRPQGVTAEFASATTYLKQELTGVRQAPVPTSTVLHELARRARG
ncbi:hypothetical protein JHN59_15180 [Streptomyces sp. MBT49]|uniref:hypothetical protein n=1 Tax=Streptomyces sp. MBT49 TaxID=1488380 RepID=UPI00190E4C5F|nr:hypothetical protein [Streptomyces sp. MBT49]MBK3626163.1 hypothetical protein [Streptomyces sp. MBT49]